MQIAKLIKLGGITINAEDADYPDYEGFLVCLACGKPVFLRKSHQRKDSLISAAFIHHKKTGIEDECELRVSGIQQQEIDREASIARGQRLQKLRSKFWYCLKQNPVINLSILPQAKLEVQKSPVLQGVVNHGLQILELNKELCILNIKWVVDEVLGSVEDSEKYNRNFQSDAKTKERLQNFVAARKRDWELHLAIAQECAEVFFREEFKSIRYNLISCLCYPPIIKEMGLAKPGISEKEWREVFFKYLVLEFGLILGTVDWVDLL